MFIQSLLYLKECPAVAAHQEKPNKGRKISSRFTMALQQPEQGIKGYPGLEIGHSILHLDYRSRFDVGSRFKGCSRKRISPRMLC